MRNLPVIFITIATVLLITACGMEKGLNSDIKRDISFSNNWKFINEDIGQAADLSFDDSEWRIIDLPHDISVEDLSVQDSTHSGPFFKGVENGGAVGFLKGGTAWYRKHFKLSNTDVEKQVIINFDGVQSEVIVYVNGNQVGKHNYGYTPFIFNITPYLNKPEKDNVIALKVTNPGSNSRWFAGFGIYRDVTLSILNPIHITQWGVFITTPTITAEHANIEIAVSLENFTKEQGSYTLIADIISPDQKIVKTIEQDLFISVGASSEINMNIALSDFLLWNINAPNLYTAKLSLKDDNKLIDEYSVDFGIRTIEYSAEKGFLLNNKEILLKGACLHHDNGLLGAAAFKQAEYRKVKIMKTNGFNAIRTSHNPPSKHFLDACDQMGVLVIDEAFDMWKIAKMKNDYHNHFDENWESDIETMLLRDRNHPSIIMWSYGNEIPERAKPEGILVAKDLIVKIKSMDNSRPTTSAICDFWDNRDLNWEQHTPYGFAIMDVAGYNYMPQKYESDHELFPNRVMYCSESYPMQAFEYWKKVEDLSYVVGDFVWTGMDHIGESGIGFSVISDIKERLGHPQPWPWFVNNCGDIDIIGNKKPQSLYRDVVWQQSKIEILVHEPIPAGKWEQTHAWGWPLEAPSWNWEGHEGQLFDVNVYSSLPKVKLYLNDKLIGEKDIDIEKGITAKFKVPYENGELKAVGFDDNNREVVKILQTAGVFSQLILNAESQSIKADRSQLVYINVIALDAENNNIPTASNSITVEVTGEAELIAAGSGNPLIDGSIQDNRFNLFLGKGLIILRSNGKEGNINIKVKSDSNINSEISMEAVSL